MQNDSITRFTRQGEIEIHQRLLQNDPLASSDLAQICLEPMLEFLSRKYPQTDQELIYEAATQAYFNYVERPNSYDPSKKGLLAFLKMAAEGDLQNLRATQKRRAKRVISLEDVALHEWAGNINIEEEFINRTENIARLEQLKQTNLRQMKLTADTPLDQKLITLMQAGERDTRVYAQLLQITQLPVIEQRRIVKQHKDRLRVRLKRRQTR